MFSTRALRDARKGGKRGPRACVRTEKGEQVSNLLRLIGRRLIALPIMIFGVTILVFFLMSLSPIDQATAVLGENATPDQISAYREEHGLNDPIIIQYCNFYHFFIISSINV